ncbi:hypothetical protein [Laspinema olomoucense]|uniref:hypothetical protein n=1 Tax=Laspinema olomoucense TaxID=3231600 RepID=UPI0021BAEF25|nr:hypothetical protein [Laspinema sp. D3b]
MELELMRNHVVVATIRGINLPGFLEVIKGLSKFSPSSCISRLGGSLDHWASRGLNLKKDLGKNARFSCYFKTISF